MSKCALCDFSNADYSPNHYTDINDLISVRHDGYHIYIYLERYGYPNYYEYVFHSNMSRLLDGNSGALKVDHCPLCKCKLVKERVRDNEN